MSTVSTTVNEVIITGKKHRRLIDKAAKLWQRISYWTKACDVEFDDGKTAQEKVGAINGITSDFTYGKSDIAASSLLTKKIKDDLNEGIINEHIQFVIRDNGKLGWKKDGADTVYPFSGVDDGKYKVLSSSRSLYTFTENYGLLLCICSSGSSGNDDEHSSNYGLIQQCTCAYEELAQFGWAHGGWASNTRIYTLTDVKVGDTVLANLIIAPGIDPDE